MSSLLRQQQAPTNWSRVGQNAKISLANLTPTVPESLLGKAVYSGAIFASGYHGYKRNNDSAGSAALWMICGALLPIVTVPVALVQGFAKPKTP